MKLENNGQTLQPAVKRYLRAVNRRLCLPRKIRSQVIQDLATGICARQEAGESWEDILRDMGAPKEMAQNLNEEMKEFCYRKSPWRYLFLALAVVGVGGLIYIFTIQSLACFLLTQAVNQPPALGIIGGTDGPTAIFVTGSSTPHFLSNVLPFLALAIAGIVGFLLLRRRKPKNEPEE